MTVYEKSHKILDFQEEKVGDDSKNSEVKEQKVPIKVSLENVTSFIMMWLIAIFIVSSVDVATNGIMNWGGESYFILTIALTVYLIQLVVYSLIVLFGEEKLQDKGVRGLLKVVNLPVYVIMTLMSRIKPKTKDTNKQENKTKKYFSQDILDTFNTKVILDNGYVTYLNNIIVSDIDGVRTTVESRKLNLQDSKDKKRALLVDGIPISDKNVEEFYDSLYADYMISKDFNEKLKEYKRLEEEEEERLENLRFMNHNSRIAQDRKKEIEHLLYSNIRQEKVVKMRDNIEKELSKIKERVEDIDVVG